MKFRTLYLLLSLIISINLSSQSRKNYKLVWMDNFNGNTIDTTYWTHEVAKPGWVNNEKQRYTNAENAKVENGNLVLTARYENNEFTSARLITRYKKIFTYGIIDIKAKLPAGNGTWPALWMLGNNVKQVGWPMCGEIDIMEHVGRNPGVIHSSIHNKSGYGATPYTGKITIKKPNDKYHIYSIEWTVDYITFFVDGRKVYHYQPESKTPENWPFDKPAYLIFNIAIGGTWGGEVDKNIFPAVMKIDWVKVYQKNMIKL